MECDAAFHSEEPVVGCDLLGIAQVGYRMVACRKLANDDAISLVGVKSPF
jgi:hypothetical protein